MGIWRRSHREYGRGRPCVRIGGNVYRQGLGERFRWRVGGSAVDLDREPAAGRERFARDDHHGCRCHRRLDRPGHRRNRAAHLSVVILRWQFCDDPESDPYVWTSGDVCGRLDGDGRGWSHLDLYGFRGRQWTSGGDREGLDERPQRRRHADIYRLRGRRDGTVHVRVDVRGRRHRQHTESDPREYRRRHLHGYPEGDVFGRRLLDLDPNRCGGSARGRGGFSWWHFL